MDKQLKEMVNSEVLRRVDYGIIKYEEARAAKQLMKRCTNALSGLKNHDSKNQFAIYLHLDGNRVLSITNEDRFPELTLDTIRQFLTLLEIQYYGEMKNAINEFDQTLTIKIDEDGKAASK